MKATLSFLQSLIEKALSNVWQPLPIILSATQKKMLLLSILLTNVLFSSFAQKTTVLLSTYDSCHVQPPQQTRFAIEALSVGSPMVRVAYVIPSNRTPQPTGVANLQHAIKTGQQFFKEQMEQNGFGAKTFIFETEDDGVTPLIHVVNVAETDEYLRGDLWGRTQQAASNAGISLWAAGEVWVVIPETHLMFPDGSGAGGVALGAGFGSGNGGGVSMIGSNALPLFHPAMITDDSPYDGKVLPELGPYPMKQDVTFAWFEGTTFSSVASSWLGALWHETGHAFGLGHDFRNDNNFHGNLMGNGLRGTRGSLYPEKYPQDYTRLEYWTALFLNVSHFFNSDKTVTNDPAVSPVVQSSVTPQEGLVHISFQASDPDGLSFAYLVYGGDMAAELLLDGTTADATFAVPYFKQGDINGYTIFVVDKQGNKTAADIQFNVPGGNNQAPIPFIRIDPPVPGLNQSITLNASQSSDVDNDPSSLLAAWDVDNDGQFDTEPSTNKTVQYHYENPGNYLIRLKLTDPAGAQTVSTAVSIKIPGEKKIVVESFTLIDAEKDEAVRELEDGLIIKQTAWEGKTFSVRANTSAGMVDRVEFDLKGPIAHEQIDGEPPYALFGDSPPGNFVGRELLLGEYVLTATPFSGSEEGIALTVTFKVMGPAPDKTLGGIGTDMLRGAISTSDGSFLLAGNSTSNMSGDKSENSRGAGDYWIVKIDDQHNKLWDKTFGGNKYDDLNSVVPSPDGGYLLGGFSSSDISGDKNSPVKGSADYWIVKIDNQGNKLWDKTFGGDSQDLLYSMITTSDGGYLLAGSSQSNISGDKSAASKGSDDYWVVKIDSQGNKIWDKTFGGSSFDDLRSVTSTVDGYLLGGNSSSDISGDKTSLNKGENDYWVVKIDSYGNKVWDKTFGGNEGDALFSVISVPDGGYLLTGSSRSNSSGDKSEDRKGFVDFWVVRINADGDKAWDRTFGGKAGQSATSAVAIPAGGYLVSGTSSSDVSGDKSENSIGEDDYWVVKIDTQGNKVWDKTLGGSDIENSANAILTPAGDFLLAGYSRSGVSGNKSEPSNGDYDYWIIELEPPIVDQVCASDVTLTSQAEVGAFSCTEVTGSLVISGNDITNLNTLSSLRTVGGSLSISDNPNLETIDLPDLDIKQGSLSISNNGKLKSISGFNNTHLANSIYIGANPKLGIISGFDSLIQVFTVFGGGFAVVQNDALTNIQAFGALRTTGNFRIVNNANLLALDGFPSLTHVNGEFQISNNESLKTISGFNKLMSIQGIPRTVPNTALLIENNALLETLEGLSSLKSISAPLDGGRFPPAPGTVTVHVTGNPKLTQCCTLRTLLDVLVSGDHPSFFARIDISGNGGCTLDDILNCEKICDGDVTLTSQAEVDAFNCTKVTGNLTVTGADITSLFGLSSLREVYGHLRIENINVPSLESLSLLDSVGGALLVMNNPSLQVIPPLSCSVQEGIEISYNDKLHQVSGFNTVKKLGWLGFQNNPKLTMVNGFDSLEMIQTSSPDPSSPTGIGISHNGALEIIPGFQRLSKVGSIRINGNNQLSSLDGFSNVSRIEGVLTISDNSSLKVINAFENLVSIVGISRHIPRAGLVLENNPLLEGFPGLSSLKEVTSDQFADISVSNNASLKNIDGLSSLTTFFALNADKTLNIRNNAVLENIDSLSSLVNAPRSIRHTYINLTGNPMLTRCCGLQPLLDALMFDGSIPRTVHIDISENGGGCTLKDILACGPQRVLGFTLLNHRTHAVIQNFQDETTIDLADPRFAHLMLQANTSPQQVGSVEFIFDEHLRHTENRFPYEFILPVLKPGTHTVRAEVYSKAHKKGEKGTGLTTTITVINSAAVISFDVVGTSGELIKALLDGDKINIEDPAFKSFSIRANTAPDQVSSVKFWLNHRFFRTEYVAPYALNGNINGSYSPWHARPGDYTLVAVPYIKVGRKEYKGRPLNVNFTIEKESAVAVVGFDVVDASGKLLMHLQDGDKIDISDPVFKAINIIANTRGHVRSVSFWLNHNYVRTENVVPYTLAGDQNGYFNTWQPRIGNYKLSATPYGGQHAHGAVGKRLSIHFKVVNVQNELARIADESIPTQGPSVSIYPVPVDNALHIRIDDLPGGDALVTIRNIHNLAVYEGTYSKSEEINTSQLRAGVYFLQITGRGGFHKVVKFLKE